MSDTPSVEIPKPAAIRARLDELDKERRAMRRLLKLSVEVHGDTPEQQ